MLCNDSTASQVLLKSTDSSDRDNKHIRLDLRPTSNWQTRTTNVLAYFRKQQSKHKMYYIHVSTLLFVSVVTSGMSLPQIV